MSEIGINVRYGTAIFSLGPFPFPPYLPLTYNDTFAVLDGFSTKMSREGYSYWFAEVDRIPGNTRIGVVFMYGPDDLGKAM